MRKILTINAIGGLCNRMRAIATARDMARCTGRQLKVVWKNNRDLGADISDLFEPMPDDIIVCQPSDIGYMLKWELPRKKNLYISSVYQRLAYKRVYADGSNLPGYADRAQELRGEIKSAKGDVLIISGLSIGGFDREELGEMFKPNAAVRKLIDRRVEGFTADTKGIHIRRTDNTMAIKGSPIELFVREMESVLRDNPDANFFLATDDAEVMKQLSVRFGDKVICGDRQVNRGDVRGMQEAVADLWALSETSGIIGSYYSSFTDLAALLGNIPLKIMRGE